MRYFIPQRFASCQRPRPWQPMTRGALRSEAETHHHHPATIGGIAHVHGHTDADAVFGMAYAQAEDDFNRVETNFITSLGRTAEAEGEAAGLDRICARNCSSIPWCVESRLRQKSRLAEGAEQGWADGLNYYLVTHPKVHPRVITRFEPWMALSFTEGSIGGDIEQVSPEGLQAVYGANKAIDEYRARYRLPRAVRFQRHRHRAVDHKGRSRPAVGSTHIPHSISAPNCR